MRKLNAILATVAVSVTAFTLLNICAMATTLAINAEASSNNECIKTVSYGNLNDFSDTYTNLNGSDFKIEGASKYAQGTLIAKHSTEANAKYILVQVQSGSKGSKIAYGENVGSSYEVKLDYDGTINKSYYVGTTFIGAYAGPIVSNYQLTVIPR